jgi:hypothetical protein
MHNDRIERICIRGDFFGTRPVEELEALLVQKRLSELPALLEGMPIGEYIGGMQAQQLLVLLQSV